MTDATFEQVVVEGSKERPVVVDLWAAWCGPCRTLGPTLEKVAAERDGAFTLAKIDVDANGVGNALLQAVGSQSIPTVVAFRDGQPVSMFIGAYPEDEVNRFVDSILPTEAEVEAAEAEAAARGGRPRRRPRRASARRSPRTRATARRLSGSRGCSSGEARVDEARPLVARHLPDPEAERLHAQIEVADWATNRATGPSPRRSGLAAAGRRRARRSRRSPAR